MSRDAIFSRIRAALLDTAHHGGSKSPDPLDRAAAVRERMARHPRNLRPARATPTPETRIDTFRALLEGQSATVQRIATWQHVPAAVASYLRFLNHPPRVRLGADPRLSQLPWSDIGGFSLAHGAARGDDTAALSCAIAGIAETGTLVLASGPDNPVTLAFVPAAHIVAVEARDIVGGLEDGFDKAREHATNGIMPRTLNLISGPSRTADIGGRIVVGAHGPRHLAVLVIDEAADTTP